jgi:tRNA-dihydrouridine synthase A
MAKRVKVPVTVKCRLGVDEFDNYDFVKNFVRIVSNDQKGSVKHFIIHSRIALLKGLNPA